MRRVAAFLVVFFLSPMSNAGTIFPGDTPPPSRLTEQGGDEEEEKQQGEPDQKRQKRQNKAKKYHDRDMSVFESVATILGALNGNTPGGSRIRHEVGKRVDELQTVLNAIQQIACIGQIAALLPEFRDVLEQRRQDPQDILGTLSAIQEIIRRRVVDGTLGFQNEEQNDAAPAEQNQREAEQLMEQPEEPLQTEFRLLEQEDAWLFQQPDTHDPHAFLDIEELGEDFAPPLFTLGSPPYGFDKDSW